MFILVWVINHNISLVPLPQQEKRIYSYEDIILLNESLMKST